MTPGLTHAHVLYVPLHKASEQSIHAQRREDASQRSRALTSADLRAAYYQGTHRARITQCAVADWARGNW